MANRKALYEILGLQEDASEEDIEIAFKRKLKECHPDLHPEDPNAAIKTRRLIEVKEALLNSNDREPESNSEVYVVFTWRPMAGSAYKERIRYNQYSYDPIADAMYKEIFAFLYRSSLRDLMERLKRKSREL